MNEFFTSQLVFIIVGFINGFAYFLYKYTNTEIFLKKHWNILCAWVKKHKKNILYGIVIIVLIIIAMGFGILMGRLIETNLTGKGYVSFWEMISAIATVVGSIGAVAVPVILTLWVRRNEKKRDEELKRREDRVYIQTYIDKYLLPVVFEYLEFNKLKYLEDTEKLVEIFKELEHYYRKIFVAITGFKYIIQQSQHSYMSVGLECQFDVLDQLTPMYERYQKSENIVDTTECRKKLNNINLDAIAVYELITNYITYLHSYLLMSSEEYEINIEEYFTKCSANKRIEALVKEIYRANYKSPLSSLVTNTTYTFNAPVLCCLYNSYKQSIKNKEKNYE